MKKVLILFVLSLTLLMVTNGIVKADVSEATLRGFDIEDFVYVDDEPNNIIELEGKKFYYGKINSWSAVYRFYNYEEDKMFYAILVEGMIDASTEKKLTRSFSAQYMKISIKFDSSYARLVSYSPEPQPGTYTITYGFGMTLTYNDGYAYVEPTISYSLSQEFDEISQHVSEGNNSVSMTFNFSRYADNVRGVPYQGAYRQRAVAYFAIDEYSLYKNYLSSSQIVIDYTGCIFKDGAWGDLNYSYPKTINDTYKYTSNGNYN